MIEERTPTRLGELRKRYKLDQAFNDVKSPLPPGEVIKVELPVSSEYLLDACVEIEGVYGLRGFVSSDGVDADSAYANISLTCNPNMDGDPNYSTLGSEKLTRSEHYYATESTIQKVGQLRDSYYDTYGFFQPTYPAITSLSKLTGAFKRNLVRSRMSVIRGGRMETTSFNWGWHKDEPVFENLRINIHVTDSPAHRIQVMRTDRMPQSLFDPDLVEHRFEVGVGYSWDTHLPHRPCAKGATLDDRIALVYGVSPWFDLVDGEWEPNEFFGKKHPHQMLVDGDIL